MIQKQKAKIKTTANHGNSLAKDGNKNHKFRWDIFNKFLIILIITSGIYYMISINDLSIKGFMFQELKTKLAGLKNENNCMELEIMELESYEYINSRAQNLEMVKVDKIDYITMVDEAVAKK